MAKIELQKEVKRVVVDQKAEVVLHLSPEEAAAVLVLITNTGGPADTTPRGLIDNVLKQFTNLGVIGFDINDPAWKELFSDNRSVYFSYDSLNNSFFKKVVNKIKNLLTLPENRYI